MGCTLVSSCPNTTYTAGSSCVKCPYACNVCSSNGSCSSCTSGGWLYNNNGTTVCTTCPANSSIYGTGDFTGTWQLTDGFNMDNCNCNSSTPSWTGTTCVVCPANSSVGGSGAPTGNGCQCNSGTPYWVSGSCSSTCSSNTYPSGNSCINCATYPVTSCSSTTGGATSCASVYQLSGSSGASGTTCVCPSGSSSSGSGDWTAACSGRWYCSSCPSTTGIRGYHGACYRPGCSTNTNSSPSCYNGSLNGTTSCICNSSTPYWNGSQCVACGTNQVYINSGGCVNCSIFQSGCNTCTYSSSGHFTCTS